jgi:cell wall-associated NlpC family hydrolase
MREAWGAAPLEKQQAVLAAMSQLGVPYRNLESDPEVGFDCSGLTRWAFAQAGVAIPRSSRDQFRESGEVELADAQPGDLVYYPGHVGMYLGVGTFVHSPNSGNHVQAAHLPDKSLRFADALDSDWVADT